MKIKEAIINTIANADIDVLWEHFVLLEGEYDEYDDELELVRYGKDVKFSIFDIWDGRIVKRGNYVNVRHPETGEKRKYKRELYRTELMFRKSLMRKRLYENTAIEGNLIPR